MKQRISVLIILIAFLVVFIMPTEKAFSYPTRVKTMLCENFENYNTTNDLNGKFPKWQGPTNGINWTLDTSDYIDGTKSLRATLTSTTWTQTSLDIGGFGDWSDAEGIRFYIKNLNSTAGIYIGCSFDEIIGAQSIRNEVYGNVKLINLSGSNISYNTQWSGRLIQIPANFEGWFVFPFEGRYTSDPGTGSYITGSTLNNVNSFLLSFNTFSTDRSGAAFLFDRFELYGDKMKELPARVMLDMEEYSPDDDIQSSILAWQGNGVVNFSLGANFKCDGTKSLKATLTSDTWVFNSINLSSGSFGDWSDAEGVRFWIKNASSQNGIYISNFFDEVVGTTTIRNEINGTVILLDKHKKSITYNSSWSGCLVEIPAGFEGWFIFPFAGRKQVDLTTGLPTSASTLQDVSNYFLNFNTQGVSKSGAQFYIDRIELYGENIPEPIPSSTPSPVYRSVEDFEKYQSTSELTGHVPKWTNGDTSWSLNTANYADGTRSVKATIGNDTWVMNSIELQGSGDWRDYDGIRFWVKNHSSQTGIYLGSFFDETVGTTPYRNCLNRNAKLFNMGGVQVSCNEGWNGQLVEIPANFEGYLYFPFKGRLVTSPSNNLPKQGSTLEYVNAFFININTMGVNKNGASLSFDKVELYKNPKLHTVTPPTVGQNLLDSVFPATVVQPNGTFTLSKNDNIKFFDSTRWSTSLDENNIFHTELKHTQTGNNWTLRIGKGGHIYSIQTPRGEIIPPQTKTNQWNDEVQQAVSTASGEHDTIGSQTYHFIHQSGTYMGDTDIMKKTFYSPILADYFNSSNKTYSVISWGQQPNPRSVHRSDLLYYTAYRDIGDGVIEVTYMMYNFGESVVLDDLVMPWGGSRKSKLPHFVIANKNGTYTRYTGSYFQYKHLNDSGGWLAMCENYADSSKYAYGWVGGQDTSWTGQPTSTQYQPSFFGYGDANRDDYNVASITNRYNVRPGDLFYYRMYIVLGSLANVQSKGNALKDNVQVGYLNYNETSANLISWYLTTDSITSQSVLTRAGSGTPVLYTYAQPVQGSLPLLLLRDTETGQLKITTDPYMICNKDMFQNPYQPGNPNYSKYVNRVEYTQYDKKTEFVSLLGYVMTNSNYNLQLSYDSLENVVTDISYFPMAGVRDDKLMVRVP